MLLLTLLYDIGSPECHLGCRAAAKELEGGSEVLKGGPAGSAEPQQVAGSSPVHTAASEASDCACPTPGCRTCSLRSAARRLENALPYSWNVHEPGHATHMLI